MTAIPTSWSFEMLSRLPPNSFVVKWRAFLPDTPQVQSYQMRTKNTINIGFRGATNEFLLNTNAYLQGSYYVRARLGTDTVTIPTTANLRDVVLDPDKWFQSPYHFFATARETMDAGALPLLDNNSPELSHEINNLRLWSARRNRKWNGASLNDLQTGCGSEALRNDWTVGGSSSSSPESLIQNGSALRILYNSGANAVQRQSYGANRVFQIPLGFFSALASTHSVIPLGMMSSYSINGWQVTLETATQGLGDTDQGYYWTQNPDRVSTAVLTNYDGWMSDIQVMAPVIKILDDNVMQAILNLYYKNQVEQLGQVAFPASLRLNTLMTRYFGPFPVPAGTTDYFFRLPGTDRSVRALAWKIYNRNLNQIGKWQLSRAYRSTRVEAKLGSENLHDVVEDRSSNSDNVRNFCNVNGRHSAALFSPLPYYQEGLLQTGQQEDDLDNYNNNLDLVVFNDGAGNILHRYPISYGYLSLENLDRREGSYSDSFQACGKDLTNCGSIDVNMRIMESAYQGNSGGPLAAVGNPAALTIIGPPNGPAGNGYLDRGDAFRPVQETDVQIMFMWVYDTVVELSPAGVVDVTKMVL